MNNIENGREVDPSGYKDLKNISIFVLVIIAILLMLYFSIHFGEELGLNQPLVIIPIYWLLFWCEKKLGFVLHSAFSFQKYTSKKENSEKYEFHIKLHFYVGVALSTIVVIACYFM